MWKTQIRKSRLKYTDEQRAAFNESRVNLCAAARRLGIRLPNNGAPHNAQTGTPEEVMSAWIIPRIRPAPSSTKTPNAKSTSGIATASGSSGSNALRLQGSSPKAAPTSLEAAVVKGSSKPSTHVATSKYEPQGQSAGIIKRKKTLVSNRPSSVHTVTPKALLVKQLNLHDKITTLPDIHPFAPLLA